MYFWEYKHSFICNANVSVSGANARIQVVNFGVVNTRKCLLFQKNVFGMHSNVFDLDSACAFEPKSGVRACVRAYVSLTCNFTAIYHRVCVRACVRARVCVCVCVCVRVCVNAQA